MASITSLTGSSSSSSIYSNPNAITGLASGLDTEAMIEQAVSAYEKKIATLQQDKTKVEWQQTEYRELIDKMASFTEKYADYTSNTNLSSEAFFNTAKITSTTGTYANMVSATGEATSELSILGVKQLATAATYSVSGRDGWNASQTLEELLGNELAQFATTDEEGNTVYEIEINGTSVGTFSADTKLSNVLSAISKSDAGVNASYSELTGRFQFTAKETGEGSDFAIGGGLAEALFGKTEGADSYKAGQDAILVVEANGATAEVVRSSNKVELDGLTVNLKGTFAAYTESTTADGKTVYTATSDAVKFSTTTDSEKVVETVKAMIEEFNELATAVKKSYSTKPLKDSSGKNYKPLTENDRSDMSESAIENYEKKAKTGLLYCDQDLSSMYNEMVNAITKHVVDLEEIGITAVYSDGLTTLKLDENKMKSELETNPDAVSDVLAGDNGFVQDVGKVTKKYGGTTGADKGILVQKAGSERAPTTVNQNSLRTIMDEYQEQIKKWQQKLSDKIDYYSSVFSRLETMIANMNSQSSALSGLMGGY